jgi:hypothetical protein
MDDVTKARIDQIHFGNAQEGSKCCWIRDLFCRIGSKCVNFVGNEMNLVLLTKSHKFDHNFAIVTSTSQIGQKLVGIYTVPEDYAEYIKPVPEPWFPPSPP